MRYYYLTIGIFVSVILLSLFIKTNESMDVNCTIDKGIGNKDAMRCLLTKIYMLCVIAENEVTTDNFPKNACYKINEIYKILKPASENIKRLDEKAIWKIYGQDKVEYVGGVKRNPNMPVAILSSNEDYVKFMKIMMFSDDLEILVEKTKIYKEIQKTDENGNKKKDVVSKCGGTRLADNQQEEYARFLVRSLKELTGHFFIKYDETEMKNNGDNKDTKQYLD